MGIRERQHLVGELLEHPARLRELYVVEGPNAEFWQLVYKVEELNRPPRIVPAQEPPVSFRDDQC